MTRTVCIAAGEELSGRRLDEALRAWLPEALGRPLSRSQVRTILIAGAVRVNGRVERGPAHVVPKDARLEARVRLERLPARIEKQFALSKADVVYEDAAVIAVDKPPGLPTHATADASRDNLVAAVRRWLGSSRAYLGVHQRLDRDTSGLVLFSKHAAAAPGLARQFEGREVVKHYRVLTVRPTPLPPQTWKATGQLLPRKGGHEPGVRVVRSGGLGAETQFERLEVFREGLLVEARPVTGRKHQIRAHLASGGLPVLGDRLYGGPSRVAGVVVPRPMLHAARLELRHPVSGEPLRFESPLPADFEELLGRLRG